MFIARRQAAENPCMFAIYFKKSGVQYQKGDILFLFARQGKTTFH
jgi:hypothetical protein